MFHFLKVLGNGQNTLNIEQINHTDRPLDAVMLTTGKDTRVFEKSIISSLKYLVDVNKFYVITPNSKPLQERLSIKLGKRVIFVDESIFPFNGTDVVDIMMETVRQKGVYPLSGKTNFEHSVWGRIGWFLQQLLKFYAGKVLAINDYVLLDSDIVWFKNISFVNVSSVFSPNLNITTAKYYYASSNQYHPAYMATLKRISGVDLYKNGKQDVFRSGICHHMVIIRSVLDELINKTEARYGIPFWQVLLNESALELTCRAPRLGICGSGSTLSEYEIYFNYARQKFPETIQIRPLMWANGPAPGLLFWPPSEYGLFSDGPKGHWLGHRQQDVMEALEKQMEADILQGYDFIAYHGYGKRRYFEMVDPDIDYLCKDKASPFNSTCSWRGYDNQKSNRSVEDWFSNCACYMANHQSGP
eukprot:gene4065-5809_t